MKLLFKLLTAVFIFALLLVGAAVFTLTRPGVQKKILEGQLPEGSSVKMVRLTTGSLELTELKLALADGTQVRFDALDLAFKPLDAILNKTIRVGALDLDGLVVVVPQTLLQRSENVAPLGPVTPEQIASKPDQPVVVDPPAPPSAAGVASPVDALYAIGQIDWLFEIESIQIDGELRDGGGNRFAMNLKSGTIRPGEESTIDVSLRMLAEEALYADLKELGGEARFFLKQNTDGGFEQVRMESELAATDRSGAGVLDFSQEIELKTDSFGEQASVKVNFNASIPRPGLFVADLEDLAPLALGGSFEASAEGEALTLSKVNLLLSVAQNDLLFIESKRAFTLGDSLDFTGEFVEVRLSELPLSMLNSWLPEGLALAGDHFSAQFTGAALADGSVEIRSAFPVRAGPLSLTQNGAALLNQVTLVVEPAIQVKSDRSLEWMLENLEVQDVYGAILSAESTGRYASDERSEGVFSQGITTQTQLSLGLQELTQQPLFAGHTSIMSGRALFDLKLDAAQEYPVQIRGRIDGLSPRAFPGQRQNYRFALQLQEPKPEFLAIDATLDAGSDDRPSSSLQFTGQVRPGKEPLEFDANLSAKQIRQRDLDLLLAALQAEAGPVTPPAPVATVSRTDKRVGTESVEPVVVDDRPAWSGLNGTASASIDELYLTSGEVLTGVTAAVDVSEALLDLKQVEASFKGGQVSGQGAVRYSAKQRLAYGIQTGMRFENLNPAMLARTGSESAPVQGQFNGEASFAGTGATLEAALDAIEGDLVITGREGLLTAFKLDNRSNLGLIGAGILGSQLNRPGISALAQAVPYFENMPFSDFKLRLSRGPDRNIVIPELKFVGRNVLIDGKGQIAASSLKDALSQPLSLQLELGAKGKLIESLETLGLLGSVTPEDGFRRWKTPIAVSGSLEDPDTSALERLLKEAAYRAVRSPEKSTEAVAGEGSTNEGATETVAAEEEASLKQNLEPELSDKEKIIRDVETGINVLNSLFGQ